MKYAVEMEITKVNGKLAEDYDDEFCSRKYCEALSMVGSSLATADDLEAEDWDADILAAKEWPKLLDGKYHVLIIGEYEWIDDGKYEWIDNDRQRHIYFIGKLEIHFMGHPE